MLGRPPPESPILNPRAASQPYLSYYFFLFEAHQLLAFKFKVLIYK